MEKCLSESDILTYCDIVNVQGSTKAERCKNILKKISTRESCISKSQLMKLTEKLGLSSKGTKKDMIKRLKGYKGVVAEVPKSKAYAIVRKSVNKNVVEEKTESCIQYGINKNYITTIQVPDRAFNNNQQWIPIRTSCYNVGYYLSSGSSNTKIGANFPGMWFPFYRIKESEPKYSSDMSRGWIWKAATLQRKESVKKYKEIAKVKDFDFLFLFFEKFEFWWQVQISAALPSAPESLWNVHPELIALKAFCLKYSWDHGYRRFYEDSRIVTSYQVQNCNRHITSPEEVNKWLYDRFALCLQDNYQAVDYPKRKGKKF